MHLVNRYVDDVLIHVTFSKRKSVKEDVLKRMEEEAIKQENKKLEDMSEAEIMKVLDVLGSPRDLGRDYCKYKSKIVGKESAASYQRLLLMLLPFVIVGNLVAYLCMDKSGGVGANISSFARSSVVSLAFFYVLTTIIYYIANRFLKNEEEKEKHAKGAWTALHLRYPKIKRPNKRMDYVIGLFIKTVLLIVVFATGNDLFVGAIVKNGGETLKVPLFLASRVQDFKILIAVILVVSIIYSILAIWRNRPDFILLILKGVSTILSAVVCFIMFRAQGIWNPDFLMQMQETGVTTFVWQSLTMQSIANFSIAIILFAASVDILHSFYRFFSNI
ncbi:hypothetical protein [Anaerosporobacter sp.]|uniref:hypothetical protein n=1 Tax=Anaerosporobacter sp. TaxID=1872529 RepID=UPI00286F9490|nr:hypothetical protein [Anaerosporobacter sp.]